MQKTYIRALITLGIIALITYAQSFFIPLAIGIFLGLILSYCIDSLEKTGVRNTRAKVFVMIGFVCALIGLVYGIFATFSYAQENRESISKILVSSWDNIITSIANKTPLSMENINEVFGNISESLTLSSFEGVIGNTFSFATNFILVLVYTVLIPIYKQKIILLLDYVSGNSGKEIYTDIQYTVTKYTQGLFILMIIVAVLYYIGLNIFHVPYAGLIAVSSALMTLVPTVGTMLGGIGAILASSLLTGSIKVALSMLLRYIGIQFLEEYLILPYVVGKKVSINVFVAILAIVAGGLLRGVAGIFLAMPIVGIIQKFLEKKKHPLYKVLS